MTNDAIKSCVCFFDDTVCPHMPYYVIKQNLSIRPGSLGIGVEDGGSCVVFLCGQDRGDVVVGVFVARKKTRSFRCHEAYL